MSPCPAKLDCKTVVGGRAWPHQEAPGTPGSELQVRAVSSCSPGMQAELVWSESADVPSDTG